MKKQQESFTGIARIEVEGLADFQRTVRRLKDKELNTALRKANKTAAEVVVDDAKRGGHIPRRTGRLAASVKAVSDLKNATIRSRLPYAGPIHYGWARRNIKAQPFLSVGVRKKRDEIRRVYADGITDAMQVLEKKGLR